jgi:Mrp family chromosome partitioning ATPase
MRAHERVATRARGTPRRILVIGKYYYPYFGGIEEVTRAYGEKLAAHHDVTVIANSHDGRKGRVRMNDGDLRNPSTSRVLAPDVDKGLVEVLTDAHTSVSDVLRRDESTGLEVLPAVSSRQAVPYSSELLSSPAMDDLLAGASTYDYVIMDLPPLGLVVDARAMAAKLDGFIIVIEWGRTPRKLIKDLLRREFLVSEKCIGIILNKVDTHKLRLYSNEPTAEYYGKQGYFRTTKAPAEVA